ncbi:ABC transporter substrate-binding protein [Ramlibacter albus]|uniref:ABC transporter substrate-binding protein n=1 Tax=Ramlibacter albus TaxID=2079448 RepID=A0A923ME93_9BURK|nr:ABC transporter substrate-binding protein [Ramlibacter albus]MBC5767402.1 ABC transporter substrate-binding protein [Ramlibacter albus]
MRPWFQASTFLCSLVLACGLAAAQGRVQGVTAHEIVLGSIQDLSGPIALYGKQLRMGMMLRVDEINEQGGIHGRKLRLIFEDSAYDPKRAVLAAQKLVDQDRIFALVGHLGAASNLATMPVLFDKGVINFFPGTATRSMFEPFHRLKFAYFATNEGQLRGPLARLVKDKRLNRVCVLYQDDEYGHDVMRAAETALKSLNMDFHERTTYKRGATDFSSQVARLKASACDLVVVGTVIRETVGVMTESRRIGFEPLFLGTHAIYTDLIPRLGGKAVDGLYATHMAAHPYLDDASPNIRFWANKYRTRFSEDPSVTSVYGYEIIDAFAAAASKAGAELTADGFVKAMETIVVPPNMFGTPELRFGQRKRLGNDTARMSQLQDGRWKVVYGYESP